MQEEHVRQRQDDDFHLSHSRMRDGLSTHFSYNILCNESAE